MEETESWLRHFTPKNLIINGLIALIPASIIIQIMKESGMGGIVSLLIIFGSIWLVGTIREEINNKLKNHTKRN